MASEPIETTRVFVSNLPRNLSSEQLASHFRKTYNVTDAHVFSNRRIGFVGFHDAATAQNAADHFNRSYIRMSKISVDLAKPIELNRGVVGQAIPSSRKGHQIAKDAVNAGNIRLSKANRSYIGEDSDVTDSRKRKREAQDDGESLRSSGLLQQEEQGPMPLRSDESHTISRTDQANTVQDETNVMKPQESKIVASDGDWLRGKTSRVLDLLDPSDSTFIRQAEPQGQHQSQLGQSAVEPGPSNDEPDIPIVQHESSEEQVACVPNARLFIRNLAFDVTERDLEDKFGAFGKIQESHLLVDNRTTTSKGMAFIQYSETASAETALKTMDGVAFHGRLLHILPASDKRDLGLTDYDISKMPVKKQKAVRRKLEANSATFTWNSLYMNPDAVIASIANRLGVSKSDVLDPTSANAAVKQAHAETQIIAETKEYLKSQGVQIESFKTQQRDNRSILLKNFPFGTSELELKDLLEPHGQITRFLLPPAGTMAVVQYLEPSSASQALKALAYKNIRGSVLYLEKAPAGLLREGSSEQRINSNVFATHTAAQLAVEDHESSRGPTFTVFIRNLSFQTTTTRLTEIFSPLSGFLSARVKTRTDAKRPGEILSMGFGFVEFGSKVDADAAIAAMNGFRLDGHDLIVKLSTKNTDIAEEQRRSDDQRKLNSNRTKIVIKNLPFQASKKDVRSLFAEYGQLKKVRVPKKFDNSSRGFAFAEFVTAREAANAMDALADTHLLGRRLVLDFVEEEAVDAEEQIRTIEKKIEQQSNRINLSKLMGTGRRKFNVGGPEEDSLA